MTPETLALVDSGADTTVLPGSWAKVLGIDIVQDCTGNPGNTAGGTTTNYQYAPGVDALLAGRKIHLQASFNPGLPVILLGREDFFAHYRIAFDQRANTMTIEAY